MQWELKPEQLKNRCDSGTWVFETTAEVEPLEGIVGQDRAVKSIDFGLKIRKNGYNIFVTGTTGTGRNSYAQSMVEQVAAREETPQDWCYIFNRDQPDQPLAVQLPTGKAVVFQNDMHTLIKRLLVEVPRALNSEELVKAKAEIIQDMQERQNSNLEYMNTTGRQLGFSLKHTEKGLVTIPLNAEGKPMEEEEYNMLDENQSREIEEKSRELNNLIRDVLKRIRTLEKETQKELDKLENTAVAESIDGLFSKMREDYSQFPKIIIYLEKVKEDVLSNIKEFKPNEEKNTLERLLFKGERSKDFTHKYEVNILVDNSKNTGAPVLLEANPTYYNLVGKVEYEAHLGVLTTDFTKIKAGALHRANGGYLILQCKDILTNVFSWYALKRALKTCRLSVENIGEHMGLVPTSSLKPEPIPLDVKVILVGSYMEYQLLYHYDEDFRKLFKIRADFDTEMERSNEHVMKLTRFISDHCKKQGLLDFTRDAVASVVDYSSRLADSQEKLSSRFNELVEIIYESDAWAQLDGAKTVLGEHVEKAIEEKIYRSNKYETKLQEMIEKGDILIDTTGNVVGQVNGLAVLDTGDYLFGKPARITVNTYVGQKGIINIEREARLSGAIHDKGVLILSGYMGEKFGHKSPLSFSASICFEQQYFGIDGDSASSTELYALLSSLAGVALKQSIAVTGSVNQKGLIQPIGGVNQKIEGFYRVCKAKGLDGQQGVIIPYQNIKNLMLNDEVITAVKMGQFHIYAVKKVEEGIEILTGLPAGSLQEDGSYTPGSIFDLVQRKIQEINSLAKRGDPKEGTVISEVK